MSAHDELLTAWYRVLEPLGGEVRLLGRLDDPLVGNGDSDDVHLFVPDLHLLSPARAADYGPYNFNYRESRLLAKLLGETADLRVSWSGQRALFTYQLGDFIDVWREFPDGHAVQLASPETHKELRDLLYLGSFGPNPDRCLGATLLLGNHDTRRGRHLSECKFQLVAHNRSPDGRPFLRVLHGDVFDWVERLPEELRNIGVWFGQDVFGVRDPRDIVDNCLDC